MGKMLKQLDESEPLAQRLHCLTCLLTEAVDRGDGVEIQALFFERGLTLDKLSKVEVSPSASVWLDRTAELEVETLAAWKDGQARMSAELMATGRTTVNLNEYRRQLKAA